MLNYSRQSATHETQLMFFQWQKHPSIKSNKKTNQSSDISSTFSIKQIRGDVEIQAVISQLSKMTRFISEKTGFFFLQTSAAG